MTRRAIWIQGDGVTPAYDAEDDRLLLSAMFGGGMTYDAASPGIGAVARGHGVIAGLGLTPNGTPNNTVKIAPGVAVIRGTQQNDQGHYVIGSDTQESLTVTAADGSNPRHDLVIAQLRDDQYPIFTGDDFIFDLIEGTPAGSPSDPTPPEDALVLGRLLIGAGAGGDTISSGDIIPLHPSVRATGGITPVTGLSAWPSPTEGDVVYRTDVDRLAVYNGSAWRHKDLLYVATGTATLAFGGASTASVNITYGVTFAAAPVVTFSVEGSGGEARSFSTRLGTPSTTSCGLRADTSDGGGLASNRTVHWMAVGTLAA